MTRTKSPKAATVSPTMRCAIYTRKSTEDGLEQEFNSLDAQREAGEAFVASQRNEGWECLPDQYEDGGFSGGNMTFVLRKRGHPVNRKRTQRLLRKMGLEGLAPGPSTSRPAPGHKVYPYLLNDVVIERPNQVWSSDITYIPMRRGFLYLVAVMDW